MKEASSGKEDPTDLAITANYFRTAIVGQGRAGAWRDGCDENRTVLLTRGLN